MGRWFRMLAFLDFEASSLAERSYPIEVGWVFEDGAGEAHLIRSAPEWTDWTIAAEAPGDARSRTTAARMTCRTMAGTDAGSCLDIPLP